MLTFAKSAYMPNAVAEGRNNTTAYGDDAHVEGMNGVAVFTTIKTTIDGKTYKIKKNLFSNQEKDIHIIL